MHDVGSSIDHAVPLLSSNTNRNLLSRGFSLAAVSFQQGFASSCQRKTKRPMRSLIIYLTGVNLEKSTKSHQDSNSLRSCTFARLILAFSGHVPFECRSNRQTAAKRQLIYLVF